MNRMGRIRKVVITVTIIQLVLLGIILVNYAIHINRVKNFNNLDRQIDSMSVSTEVIVDIHERGQATDSWEKNDAFPDKIINAKIYEAVITNNAGSNISDWTLQVNIQDDCYLNNGWCGTFEIHQFVDGQENVCTVDLRNYNTDELTVDYMIAGSDLLVPLSKGDYFIYHPDTGSDSGEVPIKSTDEISGSATIGIIMYSDTGDVDMSDYVFDYHFKKDVSAGTEAHIFRIVMPLWVVISIILGISALLVVYYEKRLGKNSQMVAQAFDVFTAYVDAKTPQTPGHSKRVAEYSLKIAQKLQMNPQECEAVYFSALVHDIGNCYVPDYILKKPSKLTPEEFEIVKTHTVKGAKMLECFSAIPSLADGAMYHHERYDGSGYPTGKSGNDIPLVGRIIAVADAYDEMNSDQAYRSRLSSEQVLDELLKNSDSQFDPLITGIFMEIIKEEDK